MIHVIRVKNTSESVPGFEHREFTREWLRLIAAILAENIQ